MRRILVIAAHPDDELLGCGATISKHIKEKDEVVVAIMATGITSRGQSNEDDLNKLREAAEKASAFLGVKKILFFNGPDNMMDSQPLLPLIKEIEQLILDHNPEIIYTHFYGDINIDHQMISQAVQTASRPIPGSQFIEVRLFEILSSTEWGMHLGKGNFVPNLYIDIKGHIEQKLQALHFYESEMREYPHPRSYEACKYLSSIRGSQSGVDFAEAFMIIRKLEK